MAGKGRKSRTSCTRKLYGKSIYIYTNGEGEQQYFESYPTTRTYDGSKGVSVKTFFKNKDPLALVKKSIKEFESRNNKEKFINYKFIVFDKDNFECTKAIKLAKENDFIPILSNPSFEVWIAYHFKDALNEMTQKEVLDLVKSIFNTKLNKKYKKIDKTLFNTLNSKIEFAINNSKISCKLLAGQNIIDKNPSTEIHKVAKEILNN